MQQPRPTTVEEKLDAILKHLEHMDRRDRWRTYSGFIRSMIMLVPTLLLLWSAWYFYQHGDELIKMMSDQAAKSAAAYTKEQSSNFIDQLKNYVKP